MKRGSFEIIRDLLFSIEYMDANLKTKLLQSTHLGWRTFDRYFKLLQQRGLIEVSEKDGKQTIVLTQKGKEVLKALWIATGYIDPQEFSRLNKLSNIIREIEE